MPPRDRSLLLYLALAVLSLASSALVGALLPGHFPRVHDEFSYLLAGQTFSHFQLTNPTPPLWHFFESHHELMVPTMMSKYPPGQGLALAVGYWLGEPIYGVWLCGSLWAVAMAWMLRSFFSRRWALLGGLLAIGQFGLTHYWAQSFWGGALTAAGGAMVFGASRRIWRQPRVADATLLGLGLVLLAFTRPFEGLLASAVPVSVVLIRVFHSQHIASFSRALVPGLAVLTAGLLFLGYYNFRVTGSPWRLPYLEYEHRYANTPYFVWQSPRPEPAIQTPALADYRRDYMVPLSRFYGSPAVVWPERLYLTTRNFLGPLLAAFALAGLLLRPRRWTFVALASLLVCSLAMVLSYWVSSHYQAVAAPLYLLLAVVGARALFLRPPCRRHFTAAVILLLSAQSLLLWRDDSIERSLRERSLLPQREKIIGTLRATGQRHLIFVRPEAPYNVHAAWVFNEVPFGSSAVLWAWDRGDVENRQLLGQFSDRTPLVMRVSDDRIEFSPFRAPSLPPNAVP